jgi:hypothetical protein
MRTFLVSGELTLPIAGLASTAGSANLIVQRASLACK